MRRIAGYALAAAAGALASWVVVLVAGFINAHYTSAGNGVVHCVGLGRLGWGGPLLILAIVGGLASYLGFVVTPEGDDDADGMETRCVACGHGVTSTWKICPHCGHLVGRTKHPDGEA